MHARLAACLPAWLLAIPHWRALLPALPAAQVVCGSMGMPTATVRMRGPDGISRVSSGIGSGPVDAAYKVGGCWAC